MASKFSAVIDVEVNTSDVKKQVNEALQGEKFNLDVKIGAQSLDGLVAQIGRDIQKIDTSGLEKRFRESKNNILKDWETFSSEFNTGFIFDNNQTKAQVNTFKDRIKTLRDEMRIFKIEQKEAFDFSAVFNASQAKQIANIETYMNKNTNATKLYGQALETILEKTKNASTTKELQTVNKEFATLKQRIDLAGASGKTFSDALRDSLKQIGSLITVGLIFRELKTAFSSSFKTIKELDDAMVELKRVTDESEDSYRNFYYTANDVAKQLGSTTAEVISATAGFVRMGYSLDEASNYLTRAASIMATVSPEMNLEQSTTTMIAIMRAFGIEAEDVLDGIVSKVNVLGNKFAMSNADVSEAMLRSAAALADANNDINQAMALAVSPIEATQDAAAVGQMLKTLQARIRANFVYCPFMW